MGATIKHMSFAKSLLRWMSSLFLRTSMFLVIGSFSFVFLIGNSQAVKDALLDSNIYNDFVDSVINVNHNQTASQSGSVPLDDVVVQRIVKQAFPATVLKEKTERVIDDAYNWLSGETDNLEFSFDFSSEKNEMNEGIAVFAADRMVALPKCTTPPTQVNVFTADCLPAGFTHEFVRAQVLNDLQSSEFLKTPIISQDSLPKTSDGQTIEEKYSFAPLVYQLLDNSVFPSLVLLALSIVIYIYVRKPLGQGIKALGKDMLYNGLVIIFLTAVFGFVIPRYTNAFGIEGDETAALFSRVAEAFVQKFDIIVINVSLQIATVGLTILLIVHINKTTGGYKEALTRSGLTSSVPSKKRRSIKKKTEYTKKPPVQSSEPKKKKKTGVRKSKKYRKIGL